MIGTDNALDDAFAAASAENRALLIPYLTGGFPDPASYVDLAVAILEAGGDALEIGVPFSDPLLDGPSIQRSQQAALDAGVTPLHCLRFAAEIHQRTEKPLLLMGAYNPLYATGLDKFCREAAAAGVSALIIPDLPLEEQAELRHATHTHGLHLIQLVAPTSTPERVQRVCKAASGFVYCISVAGVTGARSGVGTRARPLVERVHAGTSVPVAVGFGVAGPEQAAEVAAFAEGVIVGAALVDTVANAPAATRTAQVQEFVRGLRGAMHRDPVSAKG